VLGLERVIVGGSAKNTADEGQEETLEYLWPDDKALVCYVSADDGLTPGLGRTFVYDADMPSDSAVSERGSESDGLFKLEQYVESASDTEVLRAKRYADTLLLNKAAGHLITGL
jgi:hypothetical protein